MSDLSTFTSSFFPFFAAFFAAFFAGALVAAFFGAAFFAAAFFGAAFFTAFFVVAIVCDSPNVHIMKRNEKSYTIKVEKCFAVCFVPSTLRAVIQPGL